MLPSLSLPRIISPAAACLLVGARAVRELAGARNMRLLIKTLLEKLDFGARAGREPAAARKYAIFN